MKVTPCDDRPVLNPCTLEGIHYQVDPYIGCQHYCYYCFALNKAETDWSEEVKFHTDIADKMKKELAGIPPQFIYMGEKTDPYHPCEAEYKQTLQVLDVLLKGGYSVSILTKSDLVLRDLDLLKAMRNAAVSTSVAFNDNNVRKLFEHNTIDTEDRISALVRLKEEGVRTYSLICPVIPYITDVYPLIEMLAPHSESIWISGLSIQDRSDRNWCNIEAILNRHFPGLREDIEAVVFSKDHSYWADLRRELNEMNDNQNLNLKIHV